MKLVRSTLRVELQGQSSTPRAVHPTKMDILAIQAKTHLPRSHPNHPRTTKISNKSKFSIMLNLMKFMKRDKEKQRYLSVSLDLKKMPFNLQFPRNIRKNQKKILQFRSTLSQNRKIEPLPPKSYQTSQTKKIF